MVQKKKNLKIGIYSGSFNPIHIGHLALANWICEYSEIDELWFLVTPLNPLKEQHSLIADSVRMEYVRQSIKDYPKFKLNDIEFHLPKPSYTINTLSVLQEQNPGCEFYLIIGSDNWNQFDQWKDYEKIINKYHILIYPRKGYEITTPIQYPNVQIVSAPEIEVSSTFIRTALKEGKDVRFFLPEAIRDTFPAKKN